MINDGGADVSEIIAGFNDDRIRRLDQERNRGKAACCNVGLAESLGDYVAYIDDDDVWFPDHLEVLYRAVLDSGGAGGAYSDLVKVSGFVDPESRDRLPLSRRLALRRDFSREVVFEHPIILHVSLMHRRDLGEAVGGYDPRVGILIEWNITRKLAYLTDLVHVPRVTGEFWAPYGSSDRISSRGRVDLDKYRRNMRLIKSDHPPGPWPRVKKVSVIWPVQNPDREFEARVLELVDSLSHPVDVILPVLGGGSYDLDPRGLGELKNVHLLPMPEGAGVFQAFRAAAESRGADYLFLISGKVDASIKRRLITALNFMQENNLSAASWDIPDEQGALLIKSDFFLEKFKTPSDLDKRRQALIPVVDKGLEPMAVLRGRILAAFKANRPEAAWALYQEAFLLDHFLFGDNLMWEFFFPLASALDKAAEGEARCRELVALGWGSDYRIMLGRLLQAQARFTEAAGEYLAGLKEIGVTEQDLSFPGFPQTTNFEQPPAEAWQGLAECLIEIGDLDRAYRFLDISSRARVWSRPLQGLARIFMAQGQWSRAEEALVRAAKMSSNDPETYGLLGVLAERTNRREEAFTLYGHAFKLNPASPKYLEPLVRLGATLGRSRETRPYLSEYAAARPGDERIRKMTSRLDGETGET